MVLVCKCVREYNGIVLAVVLGCRLFLPFYSSFPFSIYDIYYVTPVKQIRDPC